MSGENGDDEDENENSILMQLRATRLVLEIVTMAKALLGM